MTNRFFDQILQCPNLQRHVRVHPLQLCVLFLQFPQTLDLRRRYPAILRLPFEICRHSDPVLSPNFRRRLPLLYRFQFPYDLPLTELTPLYPQPPDKSYSWPKTPFFPCTILLGVYICPRTKCSEARVIVFRCICPRGSGRVTLLRVS